MSQLDELGFQGGAATKPEGEYETAVEKIVIMPATVGRWRKISSFLLRSFAQAPGVDAAVTTSQKGKSRPLSKAPLSMTPPPDVFPRTTPRQITRFP